jgi:hypothetical protein
VAGWTEGRSFFRPDARLLPINGRLFVNGDARLHALDRLSTTLQHCNILYRICQETVDVKKAGNVEASIEELALLRIINESCLEELAARDPMALYTISKFGNPQRILDRIYGIMQVFGFKFGEASEGANGSYEWTLQDLELQLGLQIIAKYQILSQLHVHTGFAKDRRRGGSATTLSFQPWYVAYLTLNEGTPWSDGNGFRNAFGARGSWNHLRIFQRQVLLV